ncbi:hypothetical protein SAMN04487948_112105 [Halogranum amylolyticum]|uniref:Uncharacterized protein n=1 Tax=Halogranum amylolyticum TaxID=660520 RepID=A0A1H8UTW2_9EURY|nr:hypothetical protein [Halogranum amylolyticum]SEP06417.1 hypothetical protein SAMN04487948_112105 [Halogranum amylolyticum]
MTHTSTHQTDDMPDDGPTCPHCGASLGRRQTGTMGLSVTTRCPECRGDL